MGSLTSVGKFAIEIDERVVERRVGDEYGLDGRVIERVVRVECHLFDGQRRCGKAAIASTSAAAS